MFHTHVQELQLGLGKLFDLVPLDAAGQVGVEAVISVHDR